MQDVVTLGEAMVLLAAAQEGPLAQVKQFTKHTAGAETNVAVGLARLGFKVAWVSRLGDDSMGHYLRQCFEDEGIDCSQVEMVAGGKTIETMIPFVSAYVDSVDLDAKTIRVDWGADY